MFLCLSRLFFCLPYALFFSFFGSCSLIFGFFSGLFLSQNTFSSYPFLLLLLELSLHLSDSQQWKNTLRRSCSNFWTRSRSSSCSFRRFSSAFAFVALMAFPIASKTSAFRFLMSSSSVFRRPSSSKLSCLKKSATDIASRSSSMSEFRKLFVADRAFSALRRLISLSLLYIASCSRQN